MTEESAEQWRFRAAIFDAVAGKKKHLLDLLRSNHPITAEDRETLAQYIDGKLSPSKGRGRPEEPLYSPTWYLHRAVQEVRNLRAKHGLPVEAAIEVVCFGASLAGRDLFKRRNEILQALSRGKKARTNSEI
jgi:hypothetical protein